MKYSIIICGRRERGLLRSLGMTFFQRNVFPDLLNCETVGCESVRIHMVLDCDEQSISLLVPNWKRTPGIQSVVVTPQGQGELAKW